MVENNLYKIRPAGRHLFTIGKDLIKDPQAAIIELVKNAYDADSPSVEITFEISKVRDKIFINIKDFGHGMTKDDVLKKWLVPSTDNKEKQKKSPNGRIMQGKKGVGRYAASLLGDDLLLSTIATDGNKSEIYIDWSQFEKCEYLDQIDVLVDFSKDTSPSGTNIMITGGKSFIEYWTEKDKNSRFINIQTLIKELKKTLTPNKDTNDKFDILLTLINLDESKSENIKIEPFPFFNIYDYRIYGTFNNNGKGLFTYENFKTGKLLKETIELSADVICGNVKFDIKIYDRDTNSLRATIERISTNETWNYLGINETRNILNEFCGIGVYRNGFRIRPLGDSNYDWLQLDEKRVDNPGFCIGNKQTNGIIEIESEELSGLEEKSARDGLKDNNQFTNLKQITNLVINELQKRRFIFKPKKENQIKGTTGKINDDIDLLFDKERIEKKVSKTLREKNVSKEIVNEVLNVLKEDTKEKEKAKELITKKIAVYQGQATLGKIINYIIHETRKPLGFFATQIDNTEYYINKLKKHHSNNDLDKLLALLEKYKKHTETMSYIFKRIDPLAATKRADKANCNVHKIITDSISIFEKELENKGIIVDINCPDTFEIMCWEQDIVIILTNLIENSIFWIEHSKKIEKEIIINVKNDNTDFKIEVIDSGTGIPEEYINSGRIFDPEFTSKEKGMGLGLALAGEAAARNGMKLIAMPRENGAHFILQKKQGEKND